MGLYKEKRGRSEVWVFSWPTGDYNSEITLQFTEEGLVIDDYEVLMWEDIVKAARKYPKVSRLFLIYKGWEELWNGRAKTNDNR